MMNTNTGGETLARDGWETIGDTIENTGGSVAAMKS